jgi:mannitol/fructose-specific phosphotransferase system IIA component (Ntr-type)
VIVVATVAAPLLTGAVNVRMMFLIGVPKSAAVEYLELMSFLTRTLRTPDAVDRLCRITDKDEFLNAFAGS